MIRRHLVEYELTDEEVRTALREYVERRETIKLNPRFVHLKAADLDKKRNAKWCGLILSEVSEEKV